MIDSEVPLIARTVARAWRHRVGTMKRRRRPHNPTRILIAHHLLLGDAVLVTPLMAKLRSLYPSAEIVCTVPEAIAPLYSGSPYDVIVWPFGLRKMETITAMFKQDGFDLAFVPGDNRHGWLAAALRSRWIVAHTGDRPIIRNFLIDEFIAYPEVPTAMGDIFAQLIPGPTPRPFRRGDWPAPKCKDFDGPNAPYAVLHVGARSSLRYWAVDNWRAIASWLKQQSLDVVWSAGPGQSAIVEQIDPQRRFYSYAETLDLAQLWHLIAKASIMVSPDTGVAHLGRLTGTPSVTLFGPGSDVLFGRGEFWRDTPCVEITVKNYPCRDQHKIFRREVPWIRHCSRPPSECGLPSCMTDIDTTMVKKAIAALL